MRWIDIREHRPPIHMLVLFYIQDFKDGYTEDSFAPGRCVKQNGNSYEFDIHGYNEYLKEGAGKITHWTLCPPPPSFMPAS